MYKRVWILAVSAVLAGVVVSGCSSSDSTPPPESTSKIRVVNASPDAGPIDVYIGTSATPWLENLEYGQASTYLTHNTGTVALVIYDAGADPQLLPPYLTESFDLVAGASLTNVMAGLVQSGVDDDKVRLISYDDNFQNTPDASARTVHAGSDAPVVTVIIGATAQPLAIGLARWEEVGRGGVPYEAGVVLDIAVMAGGGITSFRVPALDPSASYYFILTGLISGQGAQTAPFNLLVVGPGGVVPLEAFGSRDFRMVHSVPDIGRVDTYAIQGLGDGFNRVLVKDNLPYGDATLYGQADIRQVIIEMYGVGADPDQDLPLYSQSVHIPDEASSTTVFAAGLSASQDGADKIRLFTLADEFPVPAVGMTVARLVHAGPNLDFLRVGFGDDGSDKATMDRFTGNVEGAIFLAADSGLTMVVREGAGIVDTFTTSNLAADKMHYLVLTGIKNGSPGFALLTVTQDQSLGFTDPD